MKKKLFWIVPIVLLVLLAPVIYKGVNSKEADSKDNKAVADGGSKVFGGDVNSLSVWIVYWDLSVDKEIKALNNKLKNVSYFSANFDSNSKLVMPEELINYYNETKSFKYNKYITIVNDKAKGDGSYSLKDTSLLKNLLGNEASRNSHIEDIVNLAVKYGFNGVEIDYEQIKNDMELWNNYILFINELYEKAENKGLKLRVVLESNTPFDKLNFAEGPTYVLMCYNLHGSFSKPGGKADDKFIRSSIEKMSKVPGKKDFAIATGGFNWSSNRKTTSVTEEEANGILKKYKTKVQRDNDSKCLYFSYKDENNLKHEIWYADKITLNSWIKVISEKGYDISIWRLGGNLF
ncbi:glycosyl hydrolase [Clostridium sp. P21]|uniref:Glycosyl hydrolase n=1 Tax=Clostridium muellerianum TaxID=2716538 RepID=A0A7Y0HPE6_9CLOT|nr:glycosyl hydrolase family 18 protein [Clostridium muellerianum]NMM62956.1 glycosyl hydrolase [Clostridium muellerianum]